jgi:hypothetical protein
MEKQTQERNINEMLIEITELVEMQQKAIRTADSLLHLKDCIIEILEEQKKINEKENKILRICLFSIVALYSIVFILTSLL